MTYDEKVQIDLADNAHQLAGFILRRDDLDSEMIEAILLRLCEMLGDLQPCTK